MRIEVVNQINSASLEQINLDRASLFGDGFFTTGIIVAHEFCHQEWHFERLIKSAQKLQFTDFVLDGIKESILALCNNHQNATIRISISRLQTERGYAISNKAEYRCMIFLSNLIKIPTIPCELIDANTAVSCNKSLAGIKHLNRLDSVLAASEIDCANQEVLMYHDDLVICGSRSNLFVKLNDRWLTPKLELCGVEGITRGRVLDMFKKRQICYRVADIKRSDLENVNAAFVTNSLIGIWPVASINKHKLNFEESHHFKALVNRK